AGFHPPTLHDALPISSSVPGKSTLRCASGWRDAMSVEELPEIRAARKAWVGGGSALPLVELLASMGARIEAATYARMALARPDRSEEHTSELQSRENL